jgi:hypothetical protein
LLLPGILLVLLQEKIAATGQQKLGSSAAKIFLFLL